MSIDKNHHLPNHQLEWKQKAKNAMQNITGSIYHAFKLAKTSFQDKEIAAMIMITYNSDADGHYLSECDRINVGLPIL